MANQIEGDDSIVAKKLRLMLRRWEEIASEYDKDKKCTNPHLFMPFSKEAFDYFQGLAKEADLLADDLLKTAHKWQS